MRTLLLPGKSTRRESGYTFVFADGPALRETLIRIRAEFVATRAVTPDLMEIGRKAPFSCLLYQTGMLPLLVRSARDLVGLRSCDLAFPGGFPHLYTRHDDICLLASFQNTFRFSWNQEMVSEAFSLEDLDLLDRPEFYRSSGALNGPIECARGNSRRRQEEEILLGLPRR